MKRTSLSKSVRTIALIIAIASTGLQQPASAQAQNACAIAYTKTPKGGIYDGINLSPTQQSAFDAFTKPRDALFIRLNPRANRVTKPNASIMFFPKEGVTIPPDLKKKIAEFERVGKPAQAPSLNEKYGQYGRFNPLTTLVYSQALFEEYEREMKRLENQSLEVMTPAQRRRYQQNQAPYKKINQVCNLQQYEGFLKVGNSYEMEGFFN
jgi:hypothetical protein